MIVDNAKAYLGQLNQQMLGVPKELGILQRVEGLSSGLHELLDRLDGMSSRLQGVGSADANAKQPPPTSGIYGALNAAEDRLRAALAMASELNDRF